MNLYDLLPSLADLAVAVPALGVGYIVLGMVGFGTVLVAAPVLAHSMPVSSIVPLLAVMDCAATTTNGIRLGSKVERGELVRMVPLMVLGSIAGAYLLLTVPSRPMMAALGLFLIGYALYGLFGRPPSGLIGRIWVIPLGFLGGVFSAMFGSGGFVYAAVPRAPPSRPRCRQGNAKRASQPRNSYARRHFRHRRRLFRPAAACAGALPGAGDGAGHVDRRTHNAALDARAVPACAARGADRRGRNPVRSCTDRQLTGRSPAHRQQGDGVESRSETRSYCSGPVSSRAGNSDFMRGYLGVCANCRRSSTRAGRRCFGQREQRALHPSAAWLLGRLSQPAPAGGDPLGHDP